MGLSVDQILQKKISKFEERTIETTQKETQRVNFKNEQNV